MVGVIARKHPTDALLVQMLEEAVDEPQSLRVVVEGVYRDVLVFRYVCDTSQ